MIYKGKSHFGLSSDPKTFKSGLHIVSQTKLLRSIKWTTAENTASGPQVPIPPQVETIEKPLRHAEDMKSATNLIWKTQ
jgi:hypothetical protein